MEEKEKILPLQQNTFSRGDGPGRLLLPLCGNSPPGGTANAVTEEERRNVEDGGKSNTKENVSDSHPHSSSAPYGGTFPPGEGNGDKGTPAQEDMTPKAQRQYEIWRAQAQEAKKLYPGLDMSRELRDPRFAHLLKSGVDVRTAFEVVHRDQILPAAMHAAARAVEKKLTRSMAASRPAESAMESASPALTKIDVAAMSKADRAEIIRRAARGEKIRF